jgi:HSP20 family protein
MVGGHTEFTRLYVQPLTPKLAAAIVKAGPVLNSNWNEKGALRMAEVPVRRERSSEPSLARGGWLPRFGHHAPWDISMSPAALMRRLSDEMDHWFGELREHGETAMWSPNIDVRERENNLVVSADLPGLTKDDVHVEVTNEGLAIQGERKHEHEERHQGYYHSERSYGSFRRVIPLPEGVNVEQAKAQFKDGVLEVTVPIPESARKRREIPIEAAPKTRTSGGGT